ncbi:PAS domain S-box protein [Methylomonas sp. HYX-M1]|uniref:PAS domain S-box protein n=1 Tax=Methylomonas sp. HYX-M1 TaxID=3139307 RepID=UPI00345BCEAC
MEDLLEQLNFNLLIVRIGRRGCEAADARIRRVNRTAAQLLGYQEAELADQPLTAILESRELAIWQQALSDLKASDNCFGAKVITKQRLSFPAVLSISPLPQASDEDFVLVIQALKSSNDFLVMRRVVEQSANAVMITDRDGVIAYVNPKFTVMTGYSSEELLGRRPSMLQSGKMSGDDYRAMWNALIESGEWQGEMLNKHKDGHLYWVHESVSAIRNSRGEISHFLAIEDDVSQRKATEMALEESEQRFRQMAELSGEWLWEQDPQGYYLYSSVAVEQILGLSQQQIIGKHYTELLTAQDKQAQTTFSNSQRSFHALVNHYRHKDGHLVITESTGLPLTDANGKLLKWRGVDRDITARMQYQNALIESEKRTRLILESSINAIVIMDAYGMVTDWNQRAETLFGWSAQEAIGRRLDRLIIPERFRAAHRQGMQQFLKTGQSAILNRQIEQIAVRRDGSEFPVELSISPLKLGNSYIFSGFIHDISSRKAAEQRIRQAQVELAVAQNELKIAQRIQANLLPSSAIATDQFEITGVCLPADKVGGDYYDYFYRDAEHVDIVIADVSGHSIGPSLFMAETRSALRVQTGSPASPAASLSALNQFLFDDLDHADYFISLFYMQIDLSRRLMHFANAGHPPPLLCPSNNADIAELDADGLLIGVRKHVEFAEQTAQLNDGDLVLFYTDGLIEAENPQQEFFGIQRVKHILTAERESEPQAVIDALLAALVDFCQRDNFHDDVTLVVLRWKSA